MTRFLGWAPGRPPAIGDETADCVARFRRDKGGIREDVFILADGRRLYRLRGPTRRWIRREWPRIKPITLEALEAEIATLCRRGYELRWRLSDAETGARIRFP